MKSFYKIFPGSKNHAFELKSKYCTLPHRALTGPHRGRALPDISIFPISFLVHFWSMQYISFTFIPFYSIEQFFPRFAYDQFSLFIYFPQTATIFKSCSFVQTNTYIVTSWKTEAAI